MDSTMSDSSSVSETIEVSQPQSQAQGPKRTATDAGLKPNGMRPAKSVKRRASKACQCCRSRKVRCNVVEHGAPCTNCRLDEVECIVSESKRKKSVLAKTDFSNLELTDRSRKWTGNGNEFDRLGSPQTNKSQTPKDGLGFGSLPTSAHPPYEPFRKPSEHVPHALCQSN